METYKQVRNTIYIPIWLDLLSKREGLIDSQTANLHSNMVRFIIEVTFLSEKLGFIIYIPIWLDLLCAWRKDYFTASYIFTFQYG